MSHVTCLMSNGYVDPWDMLNNFCFQVYAQKWVLVIMSHVTCHILHVTCHIAHVTCHMSNGYVDPWDMLNNFCFHVEAQKWVFVIMSHVTCHMSHVTCHMSYVKCLCWSLGHAEQFLFSCLCSNVAVYGCKRQCFFFDTMTLSCEWTNHRAGSQLKSYSWLREVDQRWM